MEPVHFAEILEPENVAVGLEARLPGHRRTRERILGCETAGEVIELIRGEESG